MSEFRAALQALVDSIGDNGSIQDMGMALSAAKALLARPEPDLTDQIYSLLVRRGYAQHEAFAISNGPSPEPRITRDWQPIETAPRDGTHILGYISAPSWYYGSIVCVKWVGEYSGWSMPGINGLELSLWRPLPSPPAASDGADVVEEVARKRFYEVHNVRPKNIWDAQPEVVKDDYRSRARKAISASEIEKQGE